MKEESDHYKVLDLPSGDEGMKLNGKQITKAFKRKALQLHPDKRPNDPNATREFQRLQSSYATLMNPDTRRVFDASLDNKASSSHYYYYYCNPKFPTSHPSYESYNQAKGKTSAVTPEEDDDKIQEALSECGSTIGVASIIAFTIWATTVPIWVTAAAAAGICLSISIGLGVYNHCIVPYRLKRPQP